MDEVKENGITRSERDEPPADYLLKIDSFSELCTVLKNAESDKYYVSPEFKAGKYKWKLVLHPLGDLEMNEKTHISLYLAIADADVKAIPPGRCVCAVFKLFVYDQSRDKYLTIHDGRVRRFHTAKTKHGFHQLLPFTTFKDPTKGFLVGNCCAFGAEVHVIKGKTLSTVIRQKLSVEKKPDGGTYTWEPQEDLSTLDKDSHSPVFNACQHKWSLLVCPKKEDKAEVQYLSLFLCLEDGNNLKGEKLYLEYDLSIKNRWCDCETVLERQAFSTWMDGDSRKQWGEEKFIPLSSIRKSYYGILEMDTVIVEARITQCSRIEAFS